MDKPKMIIHTTCEEDIETFETASRNVQVLEFVIQQTGMDESSSTLAMMMLAAIQGRRFKDQTREGFLHLCAVFWDSVIEETKKSA